MSETHSLALPFIAAEQAQKHVTHNEALGILDAVVQLAVVDRDLAAPPGAPADGDRYIVAAGATGAWAGREAEIAVRDGGAWRFLAARAGWRCWVADEDLLLVFDGAAWAELSTGTEELQNLTLLGVGTTADATNPFSAKLNKALWTARTVAEGGDGDLRYTMSKETAAGVLSLLLQTGFSGRAEIGLTGDDDLLFKVSADGTGWVDAVRIARTLGEVILGGAQPFTARALLADVIPQLQILAVGGAASAMIARFQNGPAGPRCHFAKSRAASVGLHGAVQAGDALGEFFFGGSDGTKICDAARLRVEATGAPGTNFTPSRIILKTSNGTEGPSGEGIGLEPDNALTMGGSSNIIVDANRHHRLRSYTVATVPSASPAGQLIHVSNEADGAVPAFSDGANWRRVTDRNVIG